MSLATLTGICAGVTFGIIVIEEYMRYRSRRVIEYSERNGTKLDVMQDMMRRFWIWPLTKFEREDNAT